MTRRIAGFTDNELSTRLVPCVIIGILIAIALPSYMRFMTEAKTKKDLAAIEAAEREHRKKSGAWVPFEHPASAQTRIGHCEPSRIDELSLDLVGACEVVAIAEAGSNGALVLRASGGKLKRPIERRLTP